MKKKLVLILFAVFVVLAIGIGAVGCKEIVDEVVDEFLYSAPDNIAYDGQYLTWGRVEGAKHYTVSVNGGSAVRANSTTYAYASNDTFEVTVTAVFENTEKSSFQTFKPLATIEKLTVADNGEISWDTVAGANAYSVSVNGTDTMVTATKYDALPAGSHRVKVKPVVSGDPTFYSKYSAEINLTVYSAPTEIKYDGATLTWRGNSAKYSVTVNGTTKEVQGSSLLYDSGNVDFSVSVKAVGNHTATYDSKETTEEFHYLDAVTEIFVEDGILQWNPVTGAEGYLLKIDGVEQKRI